MITIVVVLLLGQRAVKLIISRLKTGKIIDAEVQDIISRCLRENQHKYWNDNRSKLK